MAKRKPGRKRVLFVAYGGGHVEMIIPVIKELTRRDDLEVVACGLTTARHALDANGIDSLSYSDLAYLADPGYRAAAERILDEVRDCGAVSREETIAYHGINYIDLVSRLGEVEAAAKWRKYGRQAFLPLEFFARVVDELSPDLVVATNSPRSERAAICAAGALGVPSICMVDLFAVKEAAWIAKPGYSSKVCVISDYVKTRLVDAGRSADDIVITGNPAFDAIARFTSSEVRASVRRSRGWTGCEVILWASQSGINPMSLPRRIEQSLIAFAGVRESVRVVFRLHPSERDRRSTLEDVVELDEQPLYESLSGSDVVITISSTVGYQAALMGKQLITVTGSVNEVNAPYGKMGLSRHVDVEGLPAAILAELSGAPRPAISGLPPVGEATRRIARLVEELT